MPTNYYKKELVSNRIFLDGEPVPFEVLHSNVGVLQLDPEDKGELASYLDKMAQRHKLGVSAITAEEYGELKKKASEPRSRRASLITDAPLRVFNPMPQQPQSPNKDTSQAGNDPAVAAPAESVADKPPAPAPAPAPAQKEPSKKEGKAKPFKPAVAPKSAAAGTPERDALALESAE